MKNGLGNLSQQDIENALFLEQEKKRADMSGKMAAIQSGDMTFEEAMTSTPYAETKDALANLYTERKGLGLPLNMKMRGFDNNELARMVRNPNLSEVERSRAQAALIDKQEERLDMLQAEEGRSAVMPGIATSTMLPRGDVKPNSDLAKWANAMAMNSGSRQQ